MKYYCKAYQLEDLQQFSGWQAQNEADEPELTSEDVVYLWDDFTVVRSPITPDQGLLFHRVTPEWQSFCQTTLQFEIPAELRYAYE